VTPGESKEPEKSDADSGSAAEKEAEEEPNKLSEAQIDRRFAKYTKRADDAIRERDLARQEADFLRRELIAAKTSPTGPVETQPKAAPDGRPVPPNEDTWTGDYAALRKAEREYHRQDTAWQIQQALEARDQAEAERQANIGWDKKVRAVFQKDPEVRDALEQLGGAVTQAGLAGIIKASDVGAEMMLRFHQNREEFGNLLSLKDPVAMARQIGLIEAQITQQQSAQPNSAPKPQPVPPPPKLQKPPVAMDGGGGPSEFDPEKHPYNRAWKRQMLRQLEGD
jgi:hypothetical protein